MVPIALIHMVLQTNPKSAVQNETSITPHVASLGKKQKPGVICGTVSHPKGILAPRSAHLVIASAKTQARHASNLDKVP